MSKAKNLESINKGFLEQTIICLVENAVSTIISYIIKSDHLITISLISFIITIIYLLIRSRIKLIPENKSFMFKVINTIILCIPLLISFIYIFNSSTYYGLWHQVMVLNPILFWIIIFSQIIGLFLLIYYGLFKITNKNKKYNIWKNIIVYVFLLVIFASNLYYSVTNPLTSTMEINNDKASFEAMRFGIKKETYLDPFTNIHAYQKKEDLNDVYYSFIGQGTWFVYGRIQELGAIQSLKLKLSKNRNNKIGLFMGNSNTWQKDALSSGFKIVTYKDVLENKVLLKPGDIAIWPWKKNPEKFNPEWGGIACVEQMQEGKIIVTMSNLISTRISKVDMPKIANTAEYIVICEEYARFVDKSRNVPKTYGVKAYENPDESSKTMIDDFLNKGEIFKILEEKKVETNIIYNNESKVVNYFWYSISGYHNGTFTKGWVRLEPRRETIDSEYPSMETNFTGIDIFGHELGYHNNKASFDINETKFILLADR